MRAKSFLLVVAVLLAAVPALAVHQDTINLNLPGVNTVENIEIYFLHRFFGNAGDQPLMNALGTDFGANATLGMGFHLRDNIDLAILRSSLNKEYYAGGKIKINDSVALALAAASKTDPSVTTNQNSYLGAVIVQKELVRDRLAVSLMPVITNPNAANPTLALGTTAGLGFDVPYGYLENVELVLEYTPVLSGYSLRYPALAAGIKLKTAGHFFTLMFANNFQALPNNNVLGSQDNVFHFGFNITRKL
ncbi:MAG: DUF5777 family beta-barrel protein [Candidatus Margulisbacteria bacterium]|nr:DUF5777 family beta-barrel protein [Candidatus Margulisiibacteriota bacterium]